MGITDTAFRATGIAVDAARNTWSLFASGGIAPQHRTPSVIVGDGPHRTLRRFGPERGGEPVLLVTPLAAPSSCYDLMADQSLVQFLLDQGRSVYVLDYGPMNYDDRVLGFEVWIDDIVPEAIHRVAELSGNRDVDLVAWSLGGTIGLLAAAAHPELPIRSITAFGTPIDYAQIPLIALARIAGPYIGEPLLGGLSRILGGVPAPLVQIGYRATALERELLRPWFIARNITDADRLARMESIDRFQSGMYGYPGQLFREMGLRLTVANDLASGKAQFGDRTIDLAAVTVPVLALAGTEDVLAPVPAVRAIGGVLPNAAVRFETVPGSHLGLLTGPAARTTSWAHLTRFLADPHEESPGPVSTLESAISGPQSGTLVP
ncbi:MAG: alpha/beta fold hydrolase [Rhodococcus sp. (in: high G+C Gram-positive bacteria)]|uniref:alpha/beta fold hydrolase n=1 Tax=Rhodococcus sp. TaxID=1831 RepID=UPI003BB65959